MQHIVFSGIQPSGQLHIGNYFGAIHAWLELQKKKTNRCIFGIVDLHALTEGPTAQDLEQRIFDTAVDFVASGLDPDKSTIMLQSMVPQHTELAWLLNCVTPLSWLERVPTFKEKAERFSSNVNMGLMDYPVLMTADVVLYKADLVPVGYDQLPHLELAREIVRAFNARYGDILVEPKEKITPTPKIMSLADPTKKMSKSHGAKSYIALADEPATIKKKINAMVTSQGDEKDVMDLFLKRNLEIHKEFHKKDEGASSHQPDGIVRSERDLARLEKQIGPEAFHVYMVYFNLYMLLYIFATKKERKQFIADCEAGSVQFSVYKQVIRDKIANYPAFVSFRKKRKELTQSPKKIETLLKKGSRSASRRANRNLKKIKTAVGIG